MRTTKNTHDLKGQVLREIRRSSEDYFHKHFAKAEWAVKKFSEVEKLTGDFLAKKLKGVETQIDKIEVQYSRERRPGNKTRYRKQLDSLRSVRDSLITVIEKMPVSSGSVAVGASGTNPARSNAVSPAVPVPPSVQSSEALSSMDVLASSSLMASSSSAIETVPATEIAAVPAVTSAEGACVHDTVFVHDTLVVRDTVVIHDTLYVVLANKPEAASPKEKKKADKTSKK